LNTADRKRRRSKEKEQGRLHRLFFRGDLRVVLIYLSLENSFKTLLCNNFFSLSSDSDVFCFRKILLDFWGSDREKKKKKKKLKKRRVVVIVFYGEHAYDQTHFLISFFLEITT